MLQIRHNYISVGNGAKRSFGGSQMRSESKTVREVGCGVIAALDLLLYLSHWHSDAVCVFFREASRDGVIDEGEYNALVRKLSRRYFPVIPKLGINGLMLAAGLNAFFLRYGMRYRASWGLGKRRLWTEMESMLVRDIPVILSIGPNFPFFWHKNELPFYGLRPDGSRLPVCAIRAHYVTVIGMDEEWLRISSWGREYYIRRAEYEEYIRAQSGSIVSNIVKIKTV